MIGVCALVFGGLKVPPGTEVQRKKKVKGAATKENGIKSQ